MMIGRLFIVIPSGMILLSIYRFNLLVLFVISNYFFCRRSKFKNISRYFGSQVRCSFQILAYFQQHKFTSTKVSVVNPFAHFQFAKNSNPQQRFNGYFAKRFGKKVLLRLVFLFEPHNRCPV